jgi:DNA-binding beta-propeller fold protein YncE
VSFDSKVTVATSETTSMAHFIDNATLELLANVLVEPPREARLTLDGKTVWVSAEIGGTVAVIDADSNEGKQYVGRLHHAPTRD